MKEQKDRILSAAGNCLPQAEQLLSQIRAYWPFNEQEAADKREMIRRLESGEELLKRENPSAHFTASAWVTSPDRSRILMAYHNIYDSWSWLGGHADGEADLLSCAVREVLEESGLRRVRTLSEEIFSLEILTVDGHEKKSRYVSSHLHLNVTYLLEADPSDPLTGKADENRAVRWFSREEAVQASTEPWFRESIYKKLNEKLQLKWCSQCQQ